MASIRMRKNLTASSAQRTEPCLLQIRFIHKTSNRLIASPLGTAYHSSCAQTPKPANIALRQSQTRGRHSSAERPREAGQGAATSMNPKPPSPTGRRGRFCQTWRGFEGLKTLRSKIKFIQRDIIMVNPQSTPKAMNLHPQSVQSEGRNSLYKAG